MPVSETVIAPTDARSEYHRRAAERHAQANALAARYHSYFRIRNAALATIVGVFWLGEKERLLPLLAVLPIVFFVVAIVLRNRAWRAWRRALRALDFYERRLANVEGHWVGTGQQGNRFLDDQHPCARDLDLFGPGSLFERLHLPGTPLSLETLADWLARPAEIEQVRDRQAAVAELRDRLDFREVLALLGQEVRARPTADLAAWACADAPLSGTCLVRRWTVACATLTLLTFTGWLMGYGAGALVTSIALASGVALVLRGGIHERLPPPSFDTNELRILVSMFDRLSAESFTSALLRGQQSELAKAQPIRQLIRLLAALPFGPLAFPIMGTSIIALRLDAWRARHGRTLLLGLRIVGEVETLNALAAYSYENPDDPFPELMQSEPCFQAEGLGHPLLPAERCVRNDVRLDGEQQLLIVSGSNMSGKSTLLRAIGANTVLAMAGAPVRAIRLRLSPLQPGATLRLEDSLHKGRSRFFAEVTRVRQLLDLAGAQPPLLFLLDELFSGTNSADRRQGAEAVVRRLLDAGAIGLLTTHDLALTHLADILGLRAVNVHFADQHADGTMTFDYKMRPGVLQSGNGLAILRAWGLRCERG